MPGSRSLRFLAAQPVSKLESVGPAAAEKLAAVDVTNVLELLTRYPRRHIDRTRLEKIRDLRVGEESTIVATVRAVKVVPPRQGRGRPRVEVVVDDGSARLTATFFNQPWRAKQLHVGMEVTLFGKLDAFRGAKQLVNPVVDLLGDATGAVVPVYPQSEKERLTSRETQAWVKEALDRAGDFADPLPAGVRDELGLVHRTKAFNGIHRPDAWGDIALARKRLAFDELLRLQTLLVLRKKAYERSARGVRHRLDGALVQRLLDRLPFALTGAQQRAIDAIRADLAQPVPMHRLLQGDVGSGKTLVALAALLTAVQGGFQGALMAPTEVLAEQHFLGIKPLLEGLEVDDAEGSLFASRPVRVALLTNKTKAADRKVLLPMLARGEVDILIGTHAVIVENVTFAQLGVAVIDEQHRFGVEQRAALRDKGNGLDPDLLVMTATPIPRTAAMTVFGDLDVTVLDELPPGRTPIQTTWARTPLDLARAWQTVRDEVTAGRQAYVVCPLVEDSEKIEAASAEATLEELAGGELHGLRLGLLHGRLAGADKEAVMAAFRRRELDVLVATTVIEVGVDVPNATVMVILDADRFGIAQLHQLRGRVGRGAAASHCFLLGGTDELGLPKAGDVEERLNALERSTDGFELAEVDLELRGEGTILGTRQKGRSDLKLASLRRDKDLVAEARRVAFDLAGPTGHGLDRPELATLKDEVEWLVDPDEAAYLFKS